MEEKKGGLNPVREAQIRAWANGSFTPPLQFDRGYALELLGEIDRLRAEVAALKQERDAALEGLKAARVTSRLLGIQEAFGIAAPDSLKQSEAELEAAEKQIELLRAELNCTSAACEYAQSEVDRLRAERRIPPGMTPGRLGWIANEIESHRLAEVVHAEVIRCLRRWAKWLREHPAPSGEPTRTEGLAECVFPYSKGGKHTRENLQCLCRSCNSRKGAR